MNVLSLFDGMSCGMMGLEVAGVKVDNYYASEIKEHAIVVSRHNYPYINHIGDVTKIKIDKGRKIDLLIGGSPCQDLTSMGKNRNGLDGSKSSLFFHYARILKELKRYNPNIKFLLENVKSMKIKDRDLITNILGVEPIFICSSLMSAQERRRLYWTNIEGVSVPVDRKISLKSIIDFGSKPEEKMSLKKIEFIHKTKNKGMYVRLDGYKSMPITARGYAAWNTQFITDGDVIRDLTLKEYKKLQTIPDKIEFPVIKSKATDLIGDGWTVDVIAHIFKNLPK